MSEKCINNFFCISYKAEIDRHPKSTDDLLVLETNPDIYYYGHQLPEVKATPLEHHLFVLVDKHECFQDNVFKYLASLESELDSRLHIYPGQLVLREGVYMTLRFRENEFDAAMRFIAYLREKTGMNFKKDKKFKRQQALVHYKKYIELEQLHPDIYKDKASKRVYFIRLPEELDLEKFYTIANNIKNSHKFSSFEPFYAYVMVKYYQVEYFFMFYSPNCETDRLPEFKKQLYREIERLG